MPSVPSTQLKPLSWEWLAGFFDGEGCIVVRRDGRFPNGDVRIWLQVHQHARSASVLFDIREFLGSRKVPVYYRDADAHSSLQITTRQGVKLCLKRMLPYLRVKRLQAEDVLRYFSELEEVQLKFGKRYYIRQGRILVPPMTATQANERRN